MSEAPPPLRRPHGPIVPDYQPLSSKRRWLILLLAIVTAVTVILVLLHPRGGVKRLPKMAPASAAEPAREAPRETVNRVLVVPAAPRGAAAASAAAR